MTIEEVCQATINAHPKQVEHVKAGKGGLGFLVGQAINTVGLTYGPKELGETFKKILKLR